MNARVGVAAVGLVMLAAGCEAGAGPVEPDQRLDFGVPGDLLEVAPSVQYYPACGNEPLTWGGEHYYPYIPVDQAGFPNPTETGDLEPQAVADQPGAIIGFGLAVPAEVDVTLVQPSVVPPEPGDDVGTLYVYDGGHAHWRADSGALQTWLTTTEIDYMWAC